jgi:hypothetical protein
VPENLTLVQAKLYFRAARFLTPFVWDDGLGSHRDRKKQQHVEFKSSPNDY